MALVKHGGLDERSGLLAALRQNERVDLVDGWWRCRKINREDLAYRRAALRSSGGHVIENPTVAPGHAVGLSCPRPQVEVVDDRSSRARGHARNRSTTATTPLPASEKTAVSWIWLALLGSVGSADRVQTSAPSTSNLWRSRSPNSPPELVVEADSVSAEATS